VTRENAVKLKKNEYFIADLIGLSVYDEDEQLLGTLSDVLQTGANDVYVVELAGGKEVLIPAIKQCILDVDIEGGRMRVHLLEGLLE
jgi:16S rRNA processing protein RimM